MGDASNYFSLSHVKSYNYGFLVTGAVFGIPERDIERVSVPGLNGDLIRDNGRYNNITVSYRCDIPKNFESNVRLFNSVIGEMMGGYSMLTDSYDTEHFREARFIGTSDVQAYYATDSGHLVANFECKPQRFLNREDNISISSTTQIENPTIYTALPTIFFTHGGTATFSYPDGSSNSLTVDQSAISSYSYVVINCEYKTIMDSSLSYNLGSYVNGIFPKLPRGITTVTVSNGATLNVSPRWWTI